MAENTGSPGKTQDQTPHLGIDLLAGRVDQLIKDKVFPEKRLEVEIEFKLVKDKITAAVENGLFEVSKGNSKDSIIKGILHKKDSSVIVNESGSGASGDEAEPVISLMDTARQCLDKNDLPGTENNIFKVNREYSKRVDQVPFRWTFANIYAGYIWIYLTLLLAAIFFIFSSGMDLETQLKVKDPAINATAWGVIGAVLRAMWFLKSKVDSRTYRKAYNVYFISVPFLGGILGAIVYLIILGGLFALQGNVQGQPNQITINPLTIIPFAALAGYNWEWAINLFNRIGDFLMEGTSTTSTAATPKQGLR
jgi:hypothetical protein